MLISFKNKIKMNLIRKYRHAVLFAYIPYCDKLFLGVDSVSIKDGISTPNLEEASLNQAMINSAKEVIAIFDSSKLGRRSFVHIASLDKIDTIVTDSGISPDFKDYVEASGIKLHIVEV